MKKIVLSLILIMLFTLPVSALQYFYDKPIYSYPGGQKIGGQTYIKVTGKIKNESKKNFSSGVVLKIVLYDFFDNIIATKDIVITNWTAGSTKVFDELFDAADDKDAGDVRDYKVQYEVGA